MHTIFAYIYAITVVFFIIIFIFLSLLKNKNLAYHTHRILHDFFKKYIIVFFLINLFLIFFKFFIQLFFVKKWLLFVIHQTNDIHALMDYFDYITYGVYTNNVGAGLLVLCYLTTILSLFYLGDRDLFTKGTTLQYFTFFLVCTTVMVNSSNLLVIFTSFEFIFLPSIYFVYTLGYVKKVDKTIYFLLIWTLFGSFLVLLSFAYIYNIHHTLDYKFLVNKKFNVDELNCIYLMFFIGFGMKLPIFPFHYWLTKVHVEAPAGFSMFLSGFLVKTALYCFYYINLIFHAVTWKYAFIIWICLCIIEASIKMWTQVDIKKLIAFATIQEMNMLLLCVLLLQTIHNNIIVIFLIMHGILSTFMFFLVDQIQKRAQTRNIHLLAGFGTKYPIIKFYIWIMLIFYLGLPMTVKFIIEWHIGALLIIHLNFFGMFIFFCAIFFGSVGFVKCWLLLLYGQPSQEIQNLYVPDMFIKDRIFSFFLVLILSFLSFLIFLF